jgi:formylglycine-generating enzyme required for sulfatase activity
MRGEMLNLIENLFIALLVETIIILLAVILKENKQRMAVVLILGTLAAGLCFFFLSSKEIKKETSETPSFVLVDGELMLVTPSPTLDVNNIFSTPTYPPSINQKGAEMVLIPSGKFMMGVKDTDNYFTSEEPAHAVSIDSFYLDKYEVTNILYKSCVEVHGCYLSEERWYYDDPKYADHPVVYVDWYQSLTYCKWRGARLPTEAEWEYAARGTDGRPYPWGNEGIDMTLANYESVGGTTPVGAYENGKSPFGVYDMIGNVWEWVNDWFDGTYYEHSPISNPLGPDKGEEHVIRGCSWACGPGFSPFDDYPIAATHRTPGAISTQNTIGFRCAFTP